MTSMLTGRDLRELTDPLSESTESGKEVATRVELWRFSVELGRLGTE